MKSANVKIPRNLSVGDVFFVVASHPMDEHLDNPTSTLKVYSVKSTMIESIDLDKSSLSKKGKKIDLSDARVIINGRESVPFNGSVKAPEVGDMIIDENEAREFVIDLIRKERVKAEKLLAKAKAELEAVESNLAVFENKDNPLYQDGDITVLLQEKDNNE